MLNVHKSHPMTCSTRSRRLRLSPDRGFTLLEVLVSLSVIAIALVAVFKLHSQTLMMNREADFFVSAPLLAGDKLAEIEAVFPDIPSSDSGGFGERYPDYSWSVEIEDLVSESLGEVAEDLKQIDLTIAFDGGRRTFRVRTFRFVR